MRIDTIARSGPDFLDFQPYVPAIDEAGRVGFQARLADGRSALLLGDGQRLEHLFVDPGDLAPCSHPDRNSRGELAVYAARPGGGTALLGLREGRPSVLLDSGEGGLSAIGPLGPVIDESGRIAFRATRADGRAAVCSWQGEGFRIEASAGEEEGIARFEGLPVLAGDAGVLFRADRADGQQALYRIRGGRSTLLALTGEGFSALSAFPAMNEHGDVAFGALDPAGRPVLVHRRGAQERQLLPGPGSRIARIRGALLAGEALFCTADIVEGGVAVFGLRDGVLVRVLGSGDPCAGGIVAGLALNPVSVNASGELALRLLFADGGQAIVRLAGLRPTL